MSDSAKLSQARMEARFCQSKEVLDPMPEDGLGRRVLLLPYRLRKEARQRGQRIPQEGYAEPAK